MKKPIIAIDVDLTLVRSDWVWEGWLATHCKNLKPLPLVKDYNLSKYFTLPKGTCAFDFWRKSTLYENMNCLPMAIDTIRDLYNNGCEIVFVSWCFDQGQHTQSKADMLRRDFSFIDKEDFHFVVTKSKGIVKADYIIDDRHEFLNQFGDETKAIFIDRSYTQDVELTRPVIYTEDWQTIAEYFKEEGLL